MSANRKRYKDAFVRHQRENNPFESEKINSVIHAERVRVINEYMAKNEAFHKSHPKLKHPQNRRYLKDVMLTAYGRDSILIGIDIETYEHGSSILEVGLAIFDPRGQQTSGYPHISTYHLINEDCLHLSNGYYVPDKRDYFGGKQSWKIPYASIVSFIQGVIDYFNGIEGWDAVLVGHAVCGDIDILKDMGVKVPQSWHIDTQRLFALSRTNNSKTNLRVALKETHILSGNMHNAANDAYYSLQLCLKLGDPEVRTLLSLDNFLSTYNPNSDNFDETAHQTTISHPIPYNILSFAFPQPNFDID
ncbi:hypothetical protein DIURU_001566 [Diutina rugosa]|uniref:Gfd2/YDR514C-like C-terminal domain-containing protein n=1 Tax=Diutina rugosa TaxID=5481 RepID=A0A642V010_DIURU|nr:uncharacterized protein DIURU_001566 [Diutina rugosa]KAA8905138.1 hypothetical protein DIURU_001566 [Diutina rugosa]